MTHSDVLERPQLQEMIFGAITSKLIYAAAELRIADLLADGGGTSVDLAERLGAHAPSLRRLFRALSGMGVLEQTGPDRFELTEYGRPLRTDAPDSIHELVTMLCGPEYWRSWGELVDTVRSGETAWNRAHGVTWIEFYDLHPDRAANFNRAMAEHTRDAAPGIVAAADLSRFREVADVGGGDGTLIIEALRSHPDLTGAIIDLPSGLADAQRTLAAAGVEERCRLLPGDFFESLPSGPDAYILKQVLHDWDDEQAGAILTNLRRATSRDARLLVAERVLSEKVDAADVRTLIVDLLMLIATGGKERTVAEFEALLHGAGFELTKVSEPLPPFDYRVIEAAPV